MFARRGPAQAKFTPVELRELDHSPNVQVVVAPEGMEFDAESEAALAKSKSLRMVVDVLSDWAMRDPEPGPHRRIHLHFLENPIEILGADGAVVGLRTERQELTGDGTVRGTGEFTDWDVQAVYRAVGYRSEAIEDLPFDTRRFVLPNDGGRVLDLDGDPLPGIYATGWVKRGPVGLIGHTKSDAAETIAHLLADAAGAAVRALRADGIAVDALLGREGPAGHRLRRLGPAGRARTRGRPAARPGPDQGHLPLGDDGDRRPQLTAAPTAARRLPSQRHSPGVPGTPVGHGRRSTACTRFRASSPAARTPRSS